MLASREEDVLYMSPLGKEIRDNLYLFVSQTIFHTFQGYAQSLLTRIQEKLKINTNESINERTIERFELMKFDFNQKFKSFEQNSIVLKEVDGTLKLDIDLEDYPLEQFYLMMTEFENMTENYEKKREALKEQKENGFKGRNKKKSTLKMNKHLMNLVRLLLEAKELGLNGRLSTYRPKEEREKLLEIRNGLFYDGEEIDKEFFDYVKELKEDLKTIRKVTPLQRSSNSEKIQKLIVSINKRTIENEKGA
jgi:hypothetical protein